MKKFSITQLENARKNPALFANNLKASVTKSFFGGRTKFMRWQDAVGEFHKNNSLSKATKYLENSFSNRADNTKNRNEVKRFIDSLEAYVSQFKIKKFTVVDRKKNIHIDLNDKIFICGQIPIVYMNAKGGFSIYFFTQSSKGWENELRYPILQKYFAKEIYGIEVNKIEIGVYGIDIDKYNQKIYSEAEIESAYDELDNIGNTIWGVL
jgi:hypothetical protein